MPLTILKSQRYPVYASDPGKPIVKALDVFDLAVIPLNVVVFFATPFTYVTTVVLLELYVLTKAMWFH